MSAPGSKKQTIMVVDDTADVREIMVLRLLSLGFDVVEAANGHEAVELAPKVHLDLILMDLSMPVLDGFEATRQILESQETRDVPVVAVTAFCDKYSRRRALEAGCVEYVSKPVDFEVLDGLLRKHLHMH